MATDDADRYPRTSKFPKTRPNELTSKQGDSGQAIALVANYIKILAVPKCNPFSRFSFFRSVNFCSFLGDLYRYHCSFEPEVCDLKEKETVTLKIICRSNYEKFVVKH